MQLYSLDRVFLFTQSIPLILATFRECRECQITVLIKQHCVSHNKQLEKKFSRKHCLLVIGTTVDQFHSNNFFFIDIRQNLSRISITKCTHLHHTK